MKLFVVVSSLLAVATAAPSAALYATYAQPATLYAANIAAPTYLAAIPAELQSQYHSQDELGQYSYGYSGAQSAKAESKSFDGITRGSYSYVDAENKLQTVAYTADAVNGFRVAASNLPVAPVETRTAPEPVKDTPEVAAAKLEHMAAIEDAKLRNAAAEKDDSAEVITAAAPAAIPAAIPLPVTSYAAAPAASFAYSTQSIALKSAEAQPIAYTYAAPAAAAIELKAPSSFSYSTYTHSAPASYALPATIQYAAAAPLAYSTNSYAAPIASLPIASQYATFAPAAPIAIAARSQPALAGEIVALPEPVQDTPEVAKAKEEHLQAVAEAKARSLQ
ncbi:cuticle protein-like [Anopheles ziemanni]|uniref:cuticle protein-like n=1 Tax=Anopheles coustani TaxID=139045 RepID=UPI002657DD30|nr:cuticle protein-like [Anopheles coustani]XP_058166505.1 cuticle protein-like [Anopheles ziemanni]